MSYFPPLLRKTPGITLVHLDDAATHTCGEQAKLINIYITDDSDGPPWDGTLRIEYNVYGNSWSALSAGLFTNGVRSNVVDLVGPLTNRLAVSPRSHRDFRVRVIAEPSDLVNMSMFVAFEDLDQDLDEFRYGDVVDVNIVAQTNAVEVWFHEQGDTSGNTQTITDGAAQALAFGANWQEVTISVDIAAPGPVFFAGKDTFANGGFMVLPGGSIHWGPEIGRYSLWARIPAAQADTIVYYETVVRD